MRLSLILCTILCFLQISPLRSQQISPEEVMLTNIVFMRTEGLVMIQLLEQKSKNKKVLAVCKRARRYYIQTQPLLLEVIRGKMLALDERQFEFIAKQAEKKFDQYNVKQEGPWIRLYQDHIQNCIRAYNLLLQEREWASVTYFSFLALPELLNLQEEFKKLNIK